MGLSNWLFGATPGQEAGQAIKEVVGGVFDGIDKIIDNFHLSPEDKVQFQLQMAQHKLNTLTSVIGDIQSARTMQMSTKSWWPGILSCIETVGFFGGLFYLVAYGLPKEMDEFTKTLLNMLFGAVVTGYASVRNFWLGSSMSSQEKTELLHQSTPVK